MEKKKMLIIASIVAIAVLGIIITLIVINPFNNDDVKKTNDETKVEQKKEEKAPEILAKNTEEVKEKLIVADVTSVTKDRVVFEETAKVEVGDKVAVWVYSEPQFLGYFKVKLLDGNKVIEGLEAKLNKLGLTLGKHNLVIATDKGESLGYVNIVVESEGTMQEGTVDTTYVKKEVVKETVPFKIRVEYNQNQPSGNRVTLSPGVNGEKDVTYEVTYDKAGNELSRTAINETITVEATNQVDSVGKADYNFNKSTVTGTATGFMCTAENVIQDRQECDDAPEKSYGISFITVNGTDTYATSSIKKNIKLTSKEGRFYIAMVNGKKYYFENRSGGPDSRALTQADCDKFGLSCGTW